MLLVNIMDRIWIRFCQTRVRKKILNIKSILSKEEKAYCLELARLHSMNPSTKEKTSTQTIQPAAKALFLYTLILT